MNPLEIHDAAMAIADPEARRRYLEEACAGDAALRGRIEAMLEVSSGLTLGLPTLGRIGLGGAAAAVRPARDRFGRYRVVRTIGRGAFGEVWQGYDDELDRAVAIKVPNPDTFAGTDSAESFLREARTAAALSHPNLVPVHDVGRLDDGGIYVVSRFIDGSTLDDRLKSTRLPAEESARIIAVVARAVDHAHRQGFVHRDIKPANILLEDKGNVPYLADFGISIPEARSLAETQIAGTPAYMSPEQARGEKIDGRSDIFSLGSVLYEMLTGVRPFEGKSSWEILEKVARVRPVPPRQRDPAIPAELERICLQALSPLKFERHQSAALLADDLEAWLVGASRPAVEEADLEVIPKGLRSFDGDDARFFLQLLPGPRGRDGLPESVRFWKTRLEETDPDKTFAIGLLYGPSGCGKSSLVKAGIVPRLEAGVRAIVLEASGDDTEPRLLKAVRKAVPDLPSEAGMVATFAAIRERHAGKIVVILDQFEQWLQAHPDPSSTDLVAALRQCDGGRLQGLVLVRADFGLAAHRFMDAVDTRLQVGINSAKIDTFPVDHAQDVLVRFGQGLGRLPRLATSFSDDEIAFVKQATAGLAGEKARVEPVQIALFADLVKTHPWTPSTLRAFGETGGGSRRLLDQVGVAFLEESFHGRAANPAHRAHAEAAKRVLEALLPEAVTDIKGGRRSEADLLAASGYPGRPTDFQSLLGVLDTELRLITPADPPGDGSSRPGGEAPAPYYQLTHDYLVPALREWLTSERRRTARGRAEMVLAERAAIWAGRMEAQQLPSFGEWLRIRSLTRSRDWRPPERRMMARADRRFGMSAAIATILAVAVAAVAIEVRTRKRIDDDAGAIILADAGAVVPLVEKAKVDPLIGRRLERSLRAAFLSPQSDRPGNEGRKLRTAIGAALASRSVGGSADPVQAYLADSLVAVGPEDVDLILRALEPREEWIEERIEEFAAGINRLPAAAAIAFHRPELFRDRAIAAAVTAELVRVRRDRLLPWLERFRGVSEPIVAIAGETCQDAERNPVERFQAAEIVAEYGVADVDALGELLLGTGPGEAAILLERLPQHRDRLIPLLEQVVAERCDDDWPSSDPRRETLGLRSARAGAILLRLGKPDRVWPLFIHSADPRVRSHLIDLVWRYAVDPALLAGRLAAEENVSARRALLLVLGDAPSDMAASLRDDLLGRVEQSFRSDPDPGVHAAARWCLCKWDKRSLVEDWEHRWSESGPAGLPSEGEGGDRRWFVDGIGMTYTVIDGPVEFVIGSPEDEVSRDPDETQSSVVIPQAFAISTTAVTNRQLASWPGLLELDDIEGRPWIRDVVDGPDDRPAVPGLSWDETARFCNWVSEHEKIPQAQWCYEADDGNGMRAKDDAESLAGYRLPTESELEYAIRAGATTSRFFGEGESLLPRYAWCVLNSGPEKRPHQVADLKPNDLGLFDALGNCFVLANDRVLDVHDRLTPVRLGGSYYTQPGSLRCANRSVREVEVGTDGWRLVRTLPAGKPSSPAGEDPGRLTTIGRRIGEIGAAWRGIDTFRHGGPPEWASTPPR